MADLHLTGLNATQLAMLGDAALQTGDAGLARGIYRVLAQMAPGAAHVQARYGLTQRPNARTRMMLDVLRLIEPVGGATAFVGEGIATWLKNPPFIADAKFMELAEKDFDIAPSGISNWHWNLLMVLRGVQQAAPLPGDFVELGVYKGHTTKFLADYLDFKSWDRRWWLYDTFEGVPADQQDAGRNLDASTYGKPFSFEEVRDRFAPWPNITVTKGRVPEVLAEAAPEKVAFLHIDLNNSAAEVAALDFFYDRLTPGGVIVFDDFCWMTSHAQYKAEMAWFDARGLTVFPLPTGQGVFVKPPA